MRQILTSPFNVTFFEATQPGLSYEVIGIITLAGILTIIYLEQFNGNR